MKKKSNEQFLIDLETKQPILFNSIEILGEYKGNKKPILIRDKYGECLTIPSNLLLGVVPTIKAAINKTQYFISKAREVHGNKYDYSLVEYVHAHSKIKIISSEGVFEQTANNHLKGAGCPVLGRASITDYHHNNSTSWSYIKWEIAAKNSKEFESFKIYIIKCYNNNETFYKIGKTFMKIKRRFHCKQGLPYNYKVLNIIEGDAKTISELEDRLKKLNKPFKYLPKIKFNGMRECFSEINI